MVVKSKGGGDKKYCQQKNNPRRMLRNVQIHKGKTFKTFPKLTKVGLNECKDIRVFE